MTKYRGQNLALFIGIVIISLRVSCATESTRVRHSMKVVRAGKSVSLDCIVPKDPNVDLYWWRDRPSTAIAYAGRLDKDGYIFSDFNNKRITNSICRQVTIKMDIFQISLRYALLLQ